MRQTAREKRRTRLSKKEGGAKLSLEDTLRALLADWKCPTLKESEHIVFYVIKGRLADPKKFDEIKNHLANCADCTNVKFAAYQLLD